MNIEVALKTINGKEVPAVTSLQVAKTFGKRHDHVIRDIRETMAKCSESFNAPNFGESNYSKDIGDGISREYPMYLLSKDGLMMVAMAYTTPEAMRVKEAYINRFNEMERAITENRPALSREEILSQALEIIGKKNTALEQQILADAPKVEFADAVSDAEGGMTVNQFAKVLRQHGVKNMGGHRLFRDLRKHGFLMRQKKHWNVPTQKYVDKAWFKLTVHVSPDDDCIQYEVTDFIITGKGQLGLLAFFMDKYGIRRQLSLLEDGNRRRAKVISLPGGRA